MDQQATVLHPERPVVVREPRVTGEGWSLPAALGGDLAACLVLAAATPLLTGSDGPATWEGWLPLLWPAVVASCNGYSLRPAESLGDEVRRVLRLAAGLGLVAALVSYWARSDVWLHFAAVTLPSLVLLSVAGRWALRSRLGRLRREGVARRAVVAVARALDVRSLSELLARTQDTGLRVVGACLPVEDEDGHRLTSRGIRAVSGTDAEAITRAVELCDADAVVVMAGPGVDAQSLRALMWRLEATGTSVHLAQEIGDVAPGRLSLRLREGVGLVQVRHRTLAGPSVLVKQLADRVLGAVAVLVLSPLLLAFAVAIRLDSRGPALFRQVRIGQDGRPFTMIKFRTMVTDAHERRQGLLPNNDGNSVLFKMRDDPRVTRVGRLLRRFSLDELPQIFNVVSGDMSLVGPRPSLPEEVELYAQEVHRRFVVKPGLTGLWQVSGRADLGWADCVRLDLSYVDNWSLSLDLRILGRTLGAVLRGQGAY